MMINFKWPNKKGNNYAPWYVILRRLPFYPLWIVFVFIAFIFAALAFGIKDAKEWYNDAIQSYMGL